MRMGNRALILYAASIIGMRWWMRPSVFTGGAAQAENGVENVKTEVQEWFEREA